MSHGIALHVWGDWALFTRPEAKAERASYDVPTPSAVRGILESIHWKPAIRWFVDRVHVLEPIRFDALRRNEVMDKISPGSVSKAAKTGAPLHLVVDEGKQRQQRASLLLRQVAYVIEAHFELTEKAGPEDNEGKHADIFRRRARAGQCFQQPCFGCREFPAHFALLEGELPVSKLSQDAPRDLGWMLYDMDYAHNMQPLFYRPRLEQGIIDVARWKKETLCT